MKNFLDNSWYGLRHALDRRRQWREIRNSRDNPELAAVETVVDGTDSKIRLVSSYQKKLWRVVQPSLEYASSIVSRIPGALEVNSSTFISDPYVNAFFTNTTDLKSIFSHSSEIQDYMDDVHYNDASCCALLCMHRTEKTVLGVELSGNMLKKEVRQVAVSFSDHRIYSPSPSEEETRAGLRNCLFQGLVTNALERIMQLRLASHRLQDEHRILHTRLRHYRQQQNSNSSDNRPDSGITKEIAATTRALEAVEKNMLETPAHLTPQLLLEQVTDVFRTPDSFVRLRKVPLKLNKMGIKISDDSREPSNRLVLTEVVIGKEQPRVVSLAKFPKKELLPRMVFRLP